MGDAKLGKDDIVVWDATGTDSAAPSPVIGCHRPIDRTGLRGNCYSFVFVR